jgi:hypothetical protein
MAYQEGCGVGENKQCNELPWICVLKKSKDKTKLFEVG